MSENGDPRRPKNLLDGPKITVIQGFFFSKLETRCVIFVLLYSSETDKIRFDHRSRMINGCDEIWPEN